MTASVLVIESGKSDDTDGRRLSACHLRSRTRSSCSSLCCRMTHLCCTAWSCCRFDFLFGWANSQSAPSRRGLLGTAGQCSTCDGVKKISFCSLSPSLSFPPPLLLSLAHSWALVFFTFCPAESHRSSQLPCSAQWTSSFEIFHFTLRCQAPRRWVTEVWPKYSRGLKELYLTALRHLFREKQLFSAVLVCHFRTGSWPPASRCVEEQHLWSHEGDPETCPGLHRALQWRWSGHTTAV